MLSRSSVPQKFIQYRRQHVLGDVPLELLHGSEVLAAVRTTGRDDFVLVMYERR